MKIAAIADIHVQARDAGSYQELFRQISIEAEVLVVAGDLTDVGSVEDAQNLAEQLKVLTIPCVMVLGNHDYEKDLQDEILKVLRSDMVHVLDGEAVVINDVGFAGTKGFIGGFDDHILPLWGERLIKDVVQEGINEGLKLERALSKLETKRRVVLLHYSPIKETVVGEPPEIWPFLGTSRLRAPLHEFKVDVVFHGHAHRGSLAAKTAMKIPVFNVALPLLEEKLGEKFMFFELT